MAQTLELAQVNDAILRQKSLIIEDITHPQVQGLIDNLILTAISKQGVGIAAPQVSQGYRLFIIASRPNPRYPQAPTIEPTPMLNPCLIATSGEKVKDWEGCLSVPGVRGLVPREREIEVEYFDRQGHLQRQIFTDFIARIFQHELDHLDGILFTDRLESEGDRYTEEEYQAILQSQQQQS